MRRVVYAPDSERVVHETIDGEAILIDLETGIYFSLSGSGPEVWRLLLEGWTTEEIAQAFEDGGEAAHTEVESLVAALCAARLLEPVVAVPPPGAPSAAAWEPPVLQTYTDMEYFLLLDPVHDVDTAGWPHVSNTRPDAPEPSLRAVEPGT